MHSSTHFLLVENLAAMANKTMATMESDFLYNAIEESHEGVFKSGTKDKI